MLATWNVNQPCPGVLIFESISLYYFHYRGANTTLSLSMCSCVVAIATSWYGLDEMRPTFCGEKASGLSKVVVMGMSH
jgi:hypothetical protein